MQSELVDGSVILKYPISDYLKQETKKEQVFYPHNQHFEVNRFLKTAIKG